MCGITGWISYDHDLTKQRATLEAMTATMACRGPDAAGHWLDTHAALGHHAARRHRPHAAASSP